MGCFGGTPNGNKHSQKKNKIQDENQSSPIHQAVEESDKNSKSIKQTTPERIHTFKPKNLEPLSKKNNQPQQTTEKRLETTTFHIQSKNNMFHENPANSNSIPEMNNDSKNLIEAKNTNKNHTLNEDNAKKNEILSNVSSEKNTLNNSSNLIKVKQKQSYKPNQEEIKLTNNFDLIILTNEPSINSSSSNPNIDPGFIQVPQAANNDEMDISLNIQDEVRNDKPNIEPLNLLQEINNNNIQNNLNSTESVGKMIDQSIVLENDSFLEKQYQKKFVKTKKIPGLFEEEEEKKNQVNN